jgi:hypothetical protein
MDYHGITGKSKNRRVPTVLGLQLDVIKGWRMRYLQQIQDVNLLHGQFRPLQNAAIF